jgi:ribulose-phosphate 3-epimerase
MAIIVPTVTAENTHVYREQVERLEVFAERVHIDLMDGVFTPNTSISASQVWLPKGLVSDIHVMYQNPIDAVQALVPLRPNLIVIPAESDFSIEAILGITKNTGVKIGVALLPDTSVDSVATIISSIDHLLIFSGNLGYQGGSFADVKLLEKVAQAKNYNQNIEIGWDGGVNDSNVPALASGGIEVLNVGGYIHTAPNPGLAYNALKALIP